MKEIYICSKPLQCFNIHNIPNKDNVEKKTLIIVDKFNDSKYFVDSLKRHNTKWDEILFYKSDARALLHVLFSNVTNLYVNYDISILLALVYYIKRLNIYTYEEGIGSYCALVRWNKGFRSIIRRILGVGKVTNTSSFIKGVYLYRPNVFRKLRPTSKLPLYAMKEEFFSSFFNNGIPWYDIYKNDIEGFSQIKNKKILFYITSWKINDNIISEIEETKEKFDLIYIKPHPAICNIVYNFPGNTTIIKSPILVEILFSILIENKNELTVFHESSTSLIYFQEKVNAVNFQEVSYYRDFVESL